MLAVYFAGMAGLFAALAYAKAPQWVLILVSLLTVIGAIGIIVFWGRVYLKWMDKTPDALRSETFALNKMMIERGHHGDDVRGLNPRRSYVATAVPSGGRPAALARVAGDAEIDEEFGEAESEEETEEADEGEGAP